MVPLQGQHTALVPVATPTQGGCGCGGGKQQPESIPLGGSRDPRALSRQIIAAQEEMLRKERELEEARKKLAMIRQQQYKFLPSELRDEEQN